MKSYYGPFLQGKDLYWHWRKDCENFPAEYYAQIKVSIEFPKEINLCPKCNKLDLDEISSKRMTMSKTHTNN